MNILRRVEMLEAAARRTNDVGYKIVFLQESESYEEGVINAGLLDWPSDRILVIRFVTGKDGSPLSPNAPGKQTENTN
ncbi:hypothetical protein [Nitrosospira sp. Is2]|uniref:hypothetical protein n=1 Tax=Nitrosospira sp. Is2 TaxID=3080532 RepID=UPI0029546A89|nr:hypothetical protein [Nitrosospira sp. Is2]WON74532.1 hypothetical protein R5L00_03325 [Nitrosospira sp. Is2]